MKEIRKRYRKILGSSLVVTFFVIGIFVFMNSSFVSSGVGENAIVITTLEVGAVFPEILNMSINNDANIVLTPNDTTQVLCQALLEDWNNDTTISKVNATLFDDSVTFDAADDNNTHYSNSSCVIDLDASHYLSASVVDDEYLAVANCTFDVWYYANPTTWNCTAYVEDDTNRSNYATKDGIVDELLALGLPDSLDYGIVNSTEVSDEKIIQVENVGNVQFNISVNGYSDSLQKDDGYAMNCSRGSVQYIDVEYEKFNLSSSTVGVLDLSSFEASYVNLTSTLSPPIYDFKLDYRQNDTVSEAVQDSYWRIYVPKGVAGTCEGNIEFGASVALGV